MDSSASPAPAGMVGPPKRSGFFRLLARNASKNKQGLAVVMLATSCFFLSLSMLDSKRRLQLLHDRYLSLKSENDQLKLTLHSVSDVVFKDEQPAASSSDSSTPTQGGKRRFMV